MAEKQKSSLSIAEQSLVWENKSRLTALETSYKFIVESINELKRDMKEIKDAVSIFKDDGHKFFVSRDEFEDVKIRIDKIDGVISWVVRIVVGAVIVALLGLIGLNAI